MKYICEESPGVCSQEDFDHDFKQLCRDIERMGDDKDGKHAYDRIAYLLIKLSVDKGYTLPW